MKVKFIRDCEIRDPKTNTVTSAFKDGHVYDLTEAGAAHFIKAGEAHAIAEEPVLQPATETVAGEAEEAPADRRRSRD